MAGAVFDFHELDEFNRKMVRFYSKEFPGEVKKFMNKEGNDGKRILRRYIKATTKKHTGNLLKGIDKGPAHQYQGDSWQVRVRLKKPAYHAWLVEHGHGHGEQAGKYVPALGKNWFPTESKAGIMQPGPRSPCRSTSQEMWRDGLNKC